MTKIMATPFDNFNGYAGSCFIPCQSETKSVTKLRDECDEIPSGQVLPSCRLKEDCIC